jgi:uncharacterized protein (TIGR01777 family)
MTVVLAGGSGFLGRALARRLQRLGHDILTLTRHPHPDRPRELVWHPDGTAGPWAIALDKADFVVNLAGEGIGRRRWTATRKAALRDSRLLATRSLVQALAHAPIRPRLLVSISAIGYYGPHDDEAVTEDTPVGADFLARLAGDWEAEAARAGTTSTSVALVRTGLVLDTGGGALAEMLLPFRLGVGGPMGSGKQFMSWIHLHDWVELVIFVMNEWQAEQRAATARPPGELPASGRVTAWNATAPNPVTNREFARALGRALRRPAVLPAPAFALRILLGELADALLTGARVLPARAERGGFQFAFPTLDEALRQLFELKIERSGD